MKIAQSDRINTLIAAARSVVKSHIITTDPEKIPGDEIGAVGFLIVTLKRLINDRYEGIRQELVRRAKSVGRVSDDGQKMYLHSGGFDVPVAVRFGKLKPLDDLKDLAEDRGIKGLIVAHSVVRHEARCGYCGGSGKVVVEASTTEGVNDLVLAKAIKSGKISDDDVYTYIYTLQDIRPPAEVADKVKELAPGRERE